MKIRETGLDDLLVFEREFHKDNRGGLLESFREIDLEPFGCSRFVQDVHSWSSFGVIRGLHYQTGPYAQAKLVRCSVGLIVDVALDIRMGSSTFGKYYSIKLRGPTNHLVFPDTQLYVPVGFAHGFAALNYTDTHVQYKLSNYHSPQHERSIRWDDPDLGIRWFENIGSAPLITSPIVSTKDRNAESWFDYCKHPAFEVRNGKTVCL